MRSASSQDRGDLWNAVLSTKIGGTCVSCMGDSPETLVEFANEIACQVTKV